MLLLNIWVDSYGLPVSGIFRWRARYHGLLLQVTYLRHLATCAFALDWTSCVELTYLRSLDYELLVLAVISRTVHRCDTVWTFWTLLWGLLFWGICHCYCFSNLVLFQLRLIIFDKLDHSSVIWRNQIVIGAVHRQNLWHLGCAVCICLRLLQ